MPKAKQAPTKVAVAAKKVVTKKGAKTIAQKVVIKKGTKAEKSKKAPPVKESSKGIKKAPKIASPPPTKTQRPSVQPKKPQTAYSIFSSEMHTQMKGMAKFDKMDVKQKNEVVRKSWDNLKQPQKDHYINSAKDDKKRFEKETKQMEKKGYFKNQDGVDSRDLYKASKKSTEDKKEAKKRSSQESRKSENSDVCKPKKAFTPFLIFGMENRSKVLAKNPNLSITEVAKQNGEDWKKVTDDEKKRLQALADMDKLRHEKEMKQFEKEGFYVDANGVNSKFMDKKHRVQEFTKGTVMPKQASTPFINYFTEQHNILKTQMKEGEKYLVGEKTKLISECWSKMTDAQKAKYVKLSKQDHQRHDKQMEELRKNGYFMTADGKKSSDLPPPKPKRAKSPTKKPDAEIAKK